MPYIINRIMLKYLYYGLLIDTMLTVKPIPEQNLAIYTNPKTGGKGVLAWGKATQKVGNDYFDVPYFGVTIGKVTKEFLNHAAAVKFLSKKLG